MERAVEATGTDISDFNKGNIKARSRMIAQYALAGAEWSRYWDGPCSGKYYRLLHKIWRWWCRYFTLFRLNKRQGKQLLKALGADPALYEKIPTADLEEENQE